MLKVKAAIYFHSRMNVPDQESLKQLHVLSCFAIFLLAYIGLKDPSPLWTYGNTNTVNTAA